MTDKTLKKQMLSARAQAMAKVTVLDIKTKKIPMFSYRPGDVLCPQCGVPALLPCMKPIGGFRPPHRDRKRQARAEALAVFEQNRRSP
jgi:hypothetical protein